jgi:hypothetical protein
MKSFRRSGASLSAILFAVFGLIFTFTPTSAHAEDPRSAYLHALADLHLAHQRLLDRYEDPGIDHARHEAEMHIDAAIADIRHASYDDGIDPNGLASIDAHLRPGDRLDHTIEILQKAMKDIASVHDIGPNHGLRERTEENIRAAISLLQVVRNHH